MIKTYELINDIHLTTPIRCAGSPRMVTFSGGSRNSGESIRHGRFTTADEAIQAALEADSGYGRVFRCITPETATTAPKPPVEPAAGNTTVPEPPVEPIAVAGITNKQAAIEWLATNRGIDGLKPTCRAEAVRHAAAIHGVSFPDWK